MNLNKNQNKMTEMNDTNNLIKFVLKYTVYIHVHMHKQKKSFSSQNKKKN